MQWCAAMSDAGLPGATFDMLAWREEVSVTRVLEGTDLTSWSTRVRDVGHDAAASLLMDVATLHVGFAEQTEGYGPSIDMMTRATVELTRLGRIAARQDIAHPAMPATVRCAGNIADTARDLRRLLELPLGEQAGMLSATLCQLAARRPIDHRTFAHASLSVLVPAIAAAALIDFTQRRRDLWDAPHGSPILLHQAARLDRGGLGPYFANVGRLARHSRDMIALAEIARNAAAQAGAAGPAATLAPWIALLARGCGPALLNELIDDLGDAAAGDALLAILEQTMIRPATMVDPSVVMRLRDAALDNADHALAVRAQAGIARLYPESELEAALLGAIQASGGAWHQARATFNRQLACARSDGPLRERLTALETGQFAPFIVDRGFGSPPDRQARRLHRRGILPDYARRPGERIDAVQVH